MSFEREWKWRVKALAGCLVCVALIWVPAAPVIAAKTPKPVYVSTTTCAGLPRIDVTTPDGFCVGLVAQGFKFPRGVAPLPNGDIVVADLGSWKQHAGSIWLLKRSPSGYTRTRLLTQVDRPHGVTLGPDGLLYVGEVGGIFRFDPAHPRKTYIVGGDSGIAELPTSGRHPLASFVFDRAGNLFVNVGSISDNCDANEVLPDPAQPCPETNGSAPRGVIRKYTLQWPGGKVSGWSNYAYGLRNSVALAVHPQSGALLQGENSRDAINRRISGMTGDEDLPHDELNLIEQGKHYGWPYCYDDNKPSPEYSAADCARYVKPVALLPAHAAPLGMLYYAGGLLPSPFRGNLIVAYHGYRKHGHRIVAFPVDARGMPNGASRDLISGWDARKTRPRGAPVDLKADKDGALIISEDRNGTILRLVYEK